MASPGPLPLISATELLQLAQPIAELGDPPYSPKQIQTLRRELGERRATWVLAIAAQQPRAREKLGEGVWMVTEKSIAQATDRRVARYKAAWMRDWPVADLCSGSGGDALALAARGTTIAIDADPQIAAMAAANLELNRLRSGSSSGDHESCVVAADVTRYPLPASVALHVDPDRRPDQQAGRSVASGAEAGRAGQASRAVMPERYQPPLSQVAQWLLKGTGAGRMGATGGRPAVIKLAPAADLDREPVFGQLQDRSHRQWISLDGAVREQVLVCGDCLESAGLPAAGRSAVRLYSDGSWQSFRAEASESAAAQMDDETFAGEIDRADGCRQPLDYLFDIDPAVRAAGLSAAFARRQGWRTLGSPAGFFTARSLPANSDLMQCFAVVWSGGADLKRVAQAFAQQAASGQPWWLDSVKVRGGGHDPQQWLRRLRGKSATKLQEGVAVTLLIGRLADAYYAAIGQRL